MKTLLYGVLLIVLIGIGGLIYRNAVERSSVQVACTLDARVCPDGTTLGRTGPACSFPACPPPNATLEKAGIAFIVPAGFLEAPLPDAASIAAYRQTASSTEPNEIVIRQYDVASSSTALAVIQSTAIGAATGEPVPATAYTSRVVGGAQYTVVAIERFEGVVRTSYYLARGRTVLRFDAIDRGVTAWTDARLDVTTLPAHRALREMLSGLQGV